MPNQTAPRRCHLVAPDAELTSVPAEGIYTLYDNFQLGVKLAGDKPCLGSRPAAGEDYQWQSYNEVSKRINNFGSGLIHIGCEKGDRIAFYAKNCAEWVMGAEACNAYSFVNVAIYDTLGVENRQFVVDQAEIKAIVTTQALLANVCDLAPQCPHLKYVIIIDKATADDRKKASAVGLTLYSYEETEKLGASNFHEPIPPKPEDLAILMYTSGTTSRPKGVMMTHANVVAVVAGIKDAIPKITPDDSYLSYLPLAHILERAAEAAMFHGGCRVGFYWGDIRTIDKDIAAIKPTIYAGVPKVFQRVMNKVNATIAASPVHVRILYAAVFSLKYRFIQLGLPTGIFDTLVFNKVKQGLGGRCKLIVSGGAPLGGDCHKFLRVAFGCPALQGYGLTETCGGTSITPSSMHSPWEKAGAPIVCSEVKLVSAGKYSTSHDPPQGEVCVKGPNITLGYYKMPEKTASDFVVEEDGERWFHTGDVGQWNSDGTLSIVGRVKDIFKLDGGEYIAPERLETIYAQSKYVANVFVYGDSNKSNVVGVVVPDAGAAATWAKENGVAVNVQAPTIPKALCENEAFNKAILEDLKVAAATAKLNRYEQLPLIHLDGTPWTADTGLVTAALKNKRDTLAKHYGEPIHQLYVKLGQA